MVASVGRLYVVAAMGIGIPMGMGSIPHSGALTAGMYMGIAQGSATHTGCLGLRHKQNSSTPIIMAKGITRRVSRAKRAGLLLLLREVNPEWEKGAGCRTKMRWQKPNPKSEECQEIHLP